MLTTRERRIGQLAWVLAWVGLVVGQLHALARFETADGREDLELPLTAAWAEPAADLLRPLLDWGDPDLVYVTYGKVWFPVFLAFTLCAFVVRRHRSPRRGERIAWVVALTGCTLSTIATFLAYWTQWTGDYTPVFDAAWLVMLPAFLLLLLGCSALGITLLLRRFRPTLPAVLLALTVPLALAVTQVTSLGSAALPVMFGFGLLGRRIARADAPGSDGVRRELAGEVGVRPA